MLDDGVAEDGAGAGAEVHHAAGEAGFFKDFNELGGDGGSIAGGFQHHRVAGDDGSGCHAGHDGKGEVPGREDRAHAKRNVEELVALAGVLNGGDSVRKAESLPGIKLKKINRFTHVGIGFSPVLADFIGEPCAKLEFAPADDLGRVEKQGNPLLCRYPAPKLKSAKRSLHGFLGVFDAGFLVDAYDLGGAGRVEGGDLGFGPEAPATDDQIVLPAQLAGDQVQCGLHAAGVFWSFEINERLVHKAALGRAEPNAGGKGSGGHDDYSLQRIGNGG